MKTLFSTLIVATLLSTTSAFAAPENTTHDHSIMDHGTMDHSDHANSSTKEKVSAPAAKCADTVNVKVDGLVCDFCARALEKVFGKRDEVSSIKVYLDAGIVEVSMKNGQTIDDAELTKLITDSGYNVRSVERGCDE